MEIYCTKSAETGKWVVSTQLDEKIIVQDVRIGCAIRTLLNEIQYRYGEPDSDVTLSVQGW